MKTLVVVDMQNDFVTGSLGTTEAKAIVPNVVKIVKEYADNKDKIIFTRDTHWSTYLDSLEGKNLPIPHCIIRTEGHEIIPQLQKYLKYGKDVDKHGFGFYRIVDYIEPSTSDITIIGLCTDICVISNALILKSYFREVPINVVSYACAGTTKEFHTKALQVMSSCQINIL